MEHCNALIVVSIFLLSNCIVQSVQLDDFVLKELTNLRNEMSVLKQNYMTIEKQVIELKDDNAYLKLKTTKLEQKHADIQKDNEYLKRKNSELVKDLADIKKDNVHLKRKNAELEEDIVFIKKTIASPAQGNNEEKDHENEKLETAAEDATNYSNMSQKLTRYRKQRYLLTFSLLSTYLESSLFSLTQM